MKVSIKPPAQSRLELDRPTFVIVGMMRSGSNLLERLLDQWPSIRCHGELFNPKFVGFASDFGNKYLEYDRNDVSSRGTDSVAFLNKIVAASDRPMAGFRLFLDHDHDVMSEVLFDPKVKKIMLTRNLLDSYISLLIARDTDVWLTTKATSKDAAPQKVHVDPNQLMQFALRQSLFYNDVMTIMERTGQDYYLIDYSEIKELPRLNGIAEFLGISERFAKVEEPIQRQNPQSRKDKVTNYPEVMTALRDRSMARWFV